MEVSPPAFAVEQLVQSYQGRTVLTIPELTIPSASIVGLVGPNGSGKSTLLRLLAGIERPDRGRIAYRGRAVSPFSDNQRFEVALLPQDPYLLRRSVAGNVAYGLKLRGETSALDSRVSKALSKVGLAADDFQHRRWDQLSGGEARRVSLAARLVLKPKVLLLDEPTANVDAESGERIREAAVSARREWGTTVVVASHDRQWIWDTCDERLHLFRGRLLGRREVNLIFGPWRRQEGAGWGRRLGSDQVFRVPRPPSPDAVAGLSTDDLSVADDRSGAAGDWVAVNGMLVRLSTINASGRLAATVRVGEVNLTLQIEAGDGCFNQLRPGRPLRIQYPLEAVRWY
jgi:tungstate transport system ATP-binding protein